jgi:hypothetical protein
MRINLRNGCSRSMRKSSHFIVVASPFSLRTVPTLDD